MCTLTTLKKVLNAAAATTTTNNQRLFILRYYWKLFLAITEINLSLTWFDCVNQGNYELKTTNKWYIKLYYIKNQAKKTQKFVPKRTDKNHPLSEI